jgi:hypothetical protein
MIPQCAFHPQKFVYISKQQSRWCDQWFSLPRDVASSVLNIVHNELKPYCTNNDKTAHIRRTLSPPFEVMIFNAIAKYSREVGAIIVDTYVPRILSRTSYTDLSDVKEKCQRFLWFVSEQHCVNSMLGLDGPKTSYQL